MTPRNNIGFNYIKGPNTWRLELPKNDGYDHPTVV